MTTIIDLESANEIRVVPNNDGTYNIKANMTFYNNETKEYVTGDFNFERTTILKLQAECLEGKNKNKSLWTLTL